MLTLIQIRNSSNGIKFSLIKSVDENTVVANVNGREITFVYVWQERFKPHWEYFNDYKVRLGSIHETNQNGVKEHSYVFYIVSVELEN